MADGGVSNTKSSAVSNQIQMSCEKVYRTTDSPESASSSQIASVEEFNSNNDCCGKHFPYAEIINILTELAEIVTKRRILHSIDDWKTPQQQTNILSIPNEILSQIFQRYFSYLELCLLRSVCTRFSAIVSGVLENGFKNVMRDIMETMGDVYQRLTAEPVTETPPTSLYSLKTVTLLQTYSILEIILSDLSILKAVAGDNLCGADMFSPTAYLLEKSSQILRMLQDHYKDNPNSCPPLCTVDQLSTACKHFLNMYEEHGHFSDAESSYFGTKVIDILDCCVNADCEMKIWCEGDRCHMKGNYTLREHEILPPAEDCGSYLVSWLQEFRTAIQEGNADFIHWKNTEAKTALVINSLTAGTLEKWLKELLLNKACVTTEVLRDGYTLVRREVPAAWRTNQATKIDFELECPVLEAPNCARKYFAGSEFVNNSKRNVNDMFKWTCTSTCSLINSNDGES